MLDEYRKQAAERAAEGLVPKPLSAEQAAALVDLIKKPPEGEEDFLLGSLADRIPAGVTTFTLPYERVVAAIMAIAARRMQRDEEAGDRISITLRPVLIPRATWCERD